MSYPILKFVERADDDNEVTKAVAILAEIVSIRVPDGAEKAAGLIRDYMNKDREIPHLHHLRSATRNTHGVVRRNDLDDPAAKPGIRFLGRGATGLRLAREA